MTSEERHENRYQRRKKLREEKANATCGKSMEDVFDFEHMWDAGKKSCSGVRWKTSTINFETTLLTQIDHLQESVTNGTYRFSGFKHFKTIEHGKERDINSLTIQDRAVQKCFCDEIMTNAYSRSFIYDNSASLPDKGMDMTLDRLKQALRRHYRLHKLDSGIYQFDFHGYFASIPHDKAKERLMEHIHDVKLQEIGCNLIDDFTKLGGIEHDAEHPHGIGLGSQVSQNIALDFVSPIDHYIKDQLRIEGYARYMDDGYVISHSLDKLNEIRTTVETMARELGVEINEKKNTITPFRNHSFKFLKMRVQLVPGGRVVMKLSKTSIKSIRRKLKVFRNWLDEGKIGFEDVCTSYQSWRSHTLRCDSYKTLHKMDQLFVNLFWAELAVRDKKFKCTLDATWNYEVGWIYYTSHQELKDFLNELDRTRYERYMDGFVPLCDRWEWRTGQRSECAKTFDLLREIRSSYCEGANECIESF